MVNSIEHHIQRDILSKLCFSETIRFSSLKPQGLESNIFMYHLKQLIKAGLVAKNVGGSYELTPQGLAYADKLSFSTKRLAVQPKIVIYLHITDQEGAQLFWRRKIQPSIDQVGVPIGKMHYGEDGSVGASRELLEKTGLKNVKLDYRGTANLRFYTQNILISNIICLVFVGQVNTIQPKLISGELGEVFWADKAKINNLLPSVPFMNEKIKASQDKYFFAEKSFYLE